MKTCYRAIKPLIEGGIRFTTFERTRAPRTVQHRATRRNAAVILSVTPRRRDAQRRVARRRLFMRQRDENHGRCHADDARRYLRMPEAQDALTRVVARVAAMRPFFESADVACSSSGGAASQTRGAVRCNEAQTDADDASIRFVRVAR